MFSHADAAAKEKAVRAFQGGVASRLGRHLGSWLVVGAACALAYLSYAAAGIFQASPATGARTVLALRAPVTLFRDARDVPHIRARNEYDAYFAEGFAQASDRLFQMDLIRRYVYGQLAEMLGPIQLDSDEQMRALDVRDIAQRQWRHLSGREREWLEAFSSGVNAAMLREPLPLEFRLLLYRPRPWTPRDCLAVALAMSVSLGDTPQNVMQRDALWRSSTRAQYSRLLPLSDDRYDVAADGWAKRGRVPDEHLAWAPKRGLSLNGFGSNAWAAGSNRTIDHRALIANDPHLTIGIPGIWYLVEIRSPHLHVAGLTIPGVPGVVLGHNDRIAWATTNAMVSTLSVFQAGSLSRRGWKAERFGVRFAPDRARAYYRTAREFAIPLEDGRGAVLVRWPAFSSSASALSTVLRLDEARTPEQAIRILRSYAGPPQNFLIAGSNGEVAYHLAGQIPDDPAWGRYVHPSADLVKPYPLVAFEALPHAGPSRDIVLLSANNKMYAPGYPYRLSPMFAPPYRAFRIAQMLRARRVYDAGYFEQMQLDTISPVDAEFARELAAYARTHSGLLTARQAHELAAWGGSFDPHSRTATLEHALRAAVESSAISPYAALGAARQSNPPLQVLDQLREIARTALPQPWAQAGRVDVLHPFGPIGFPFFDVPALPGNGDQYTIRVQTPVLAQSFRAVWSVGDWETGGASIPSGESGRLGSPHYDDLRTAWIDGALPALPFSDAAARRAARTQLLLTPAR